MTKNDENRFFKKIAVSVAQYFKSCRLILNANEKFLEIKMIRERRSTNPGSLTRFGSGHCNRGTDSMEIPISTPKYSLSICTK